MTDQSSAIQRLSETRRRIREQKPLIHCITNHISINDCANAVLAVGARPIMAEHPSEVEEITMSASALAVNLGNINDARMQSMLLSGAAAHKNGIPCVMDAVGAGCSRLRLAFAEKFIRECRPSVIKGNISEIMAVCGMENGASGIDAGAGDAVRAENEAHYGMLLTKLAKSAGAVVMATGATDVIADGEQVYLVKNGCAALSSVTGTGCMVTALTAAFISDGDAALGAILATALMGISGEKACSPNVGSGTFRVRLMDSLSILTDAELSEKLKLWRL